MKDELSGVGLIITLQKANESECVMHANTKGNCKFGEIFLIREFM